MDQTKSVKVSASIETNSITIFGYTSPEARVELSNSKTFSLTYSDNNGFYLFDRTYLPKEVGELCLSSIDENNLRTNPVCIPQPPPTNYHTDIGPIILPPTIALDSENIISGSTAIASGQSIPQSNINIHLYQIEKSPPLLVKPANAFELPAFSTVTDNHGNYSFNLPTVYSSDYRLFVSTEFEQSYSPKSNTLTYTLPKIIDYQLITIYLTTLLFFWTLIYLYLKPTKRYLPSIFYFPLVKLNHD